MRTWYDFRKPDHGHWRLTPNPKSDLIALAEQGIGAERDFNLEWLFERFEQTPEQIR